MGSMGLARKGYGLGPGGAQSWHGKGVCRLHPLGLSAYDQTLRKLADTNIEIPTWTFETISFQKFLFFV